MVTRDNDIIVRDSEILGGIPGGARVPFKNLLDYIEVATLAEFSPETSQDNQASGEWATAGVIFDS
jgi:hypothetical protein